MKITKKKRLEKAKVKLKAKKLPKGHNVTNTAFKVRKIVIPGQLKSPNEEDILTKKKHSLQVLLAHLDHYKVNMRRDGLSGIKELVINHEQEIFSLYLPKVIDAVGKLLIDPEHEIRKSCVELLEIILSKAPSIHIEPHINVLLAYMNCAMTHISPSTRVDSMRMLDVLLKLSPKSMVDKADEILPTFLDLISSSKRSSGHSRVLFVNVAKKITDIQWRLKVLTGLTKYFSAIVSLSSNKESRNAKNPPTIKWDGKSCLFIGEYINQERSNVEKGYLPGILENSEFGMNFQSNSIVQKENVLRNLIENLMPILLDSWIEVSPRDKDERIHLLSHETSIMLYCILEIILSLWNSLENWENVSAEKESLLQWFMNNYHKKVVATFLPGFPYVLRGNNSSLNQLHNKPVELTDEEKLLFESSVSLSSKCPHQNLSLCFLFISFNQENDENSAKLIVEFVRRTIEKYVTPDLLPLLKKVLKVMFCSPSKNIPKPDIAKTIIKKCQNESTNKVCKHGLFSFLCDVFLSPRCPINLRSKELEKWVADFPGLLLKDEISLKIIKVLRVLASQNHEIFIRNLKKQRYCIVDSLCKIKITECSNQLEGQKAIADILFRVADHRMFQTLCGRTRNTGGNEELLNYVESLKQSHKYLLCNF